MTADPATRSWAVKSGIPRHEPGAADLSSAIQRCDVLLSIGNYAIIPAGLLASATRLSVNYHYGPLPEFSGLHAPSWAIAERAADYAVTWHRLTELVDGGDVLLRVPVPLEPGDTALSLGLKCDDAAVASVGELIDSIAEGQETATPQDLAARRYFSRHTQFDAEGLIDWASDAEQIAAMARAADFGPFSSPLVWPKVNVEGRLLAVREARADGTAGDAAPGQVIACNDAGLHVATAAGSVHLTRLSTLEGEPAGPLAIEPGTILPSPGDQERARITEAGSAASRAAGYWRKRLAGGHPYRLPYTPPALGTELDGSPVTVRCHPAGGGGRTGPAYLTAAFCTFLSRAAGRPDIQIAVAAPGAESGFPDLFTSWLPLRARTGGTVADSLRAVGEEFAAGQQRAWLRRDAIGRDEVLRELWSDGTLTPDVLISWPGAATAADRPVLELALGENNETVEFRYDPARLARPDIERLAAQFSDWCERLPTLADEPLGTAEVSSADERRALIEDFNATADDSLTGRCLHRRYEQAAEAHADGIALVCGDEELTHAELNARANRLARLLAGRGVGRGDLVGVALDRSIELVVALLAVLKAGAAYVPVDPGFPAERIGLTLDSASPKLILAPAATPLNLSAWAELCLSVADADASDDATNLDTEVGPDDLAYVIYTSGSTGTPKGVEISHGALGNFLGSMRQRPGCDETDRLLAVTTISFDIAVLELFLPLLCGATTVIAQAHEVVDVEAMLALLRRHAITMMQGTPSTWQLLLDSGWHGRLAKILCGGEALPRQLASRLLACGDAVWNMYGPTETTIWSSAWQVAEGGDVIIGEPVANTQLYVLDENLAPVPAGFPGELCIGGAGVARCYHDDPEQTLARFAANPFHGGTLFRTGDLARFSEPGRLVVLGRNDGQVKLRGYRIELGDIESAITAHDEVSRAVVTGRDGQLVAYCVRAPATAAQDDQVRADALAEWAGAWDRAYEADAPDAAFNLAGWRSSYDGLPFSGGEMRDWQLSSVRRILSAEPGSVFEIGSGSGLMLFSIAPHCASYHAVDASPRAVDLIRANLGSLPQVTCERREAHELPEVAAGAFDTVVINSVAQYFPNADYLLAVLGWAVRAVGTGRVFLGDVRDLSLLSVFHADVAQFRNGQLSGAELASRAAHGVARDRELVLSPEFFANLPSLLPQVSRVDIALRDGHYVNEMTRYRYDVTLHVGESQPEPGPVTELDWQASGLSVATLGDRLAEGGPVRLAGVPNGRLSEVHGRVGAALGAGAPPGSWVDPADLRAVASAAGRELALLPSRSGDKWSFDAVLWRPGETPDLSLHPARPAARDELAGYANVPAAGQPAGERLGKVLRPWLAGRLPSYMVPAFFVELDDFPLTPSGKIDTRALPDPVEGIEATARPASELERDILAVWAQVLGHDRIGIGDNFFEIGGNSLRVVRVQAALEKLLGRPVSSARLFEHFTIRALAAHLAGEKKAGQRLIPARRRAADDEDIAIIAMSCRLPGGVRSPEQYWELLERGVDGIVEVPKDRWDADALYDPDPEARGKSYCRYGGFVSPIDLFDAAFFGISPREARALDPMQRMVLETIWEAFERAGATMDELRGSQTGAFIGVGKSSAYHEYGLTAAGGLADLDGYVGPGSAGGTMSGRVSYVFGLEGPTMTVDTACSSSLVTTHLACNALRAGECDLAVSAGVSLMLSPELHVEFSRLRGMSPDGRCRSFSADTEGTGWSEGAAAV
ncbi:MAG TPA: amino acid adenylation domain-containing protein, partial [Streptosporangiaceae bacterium]